MCVPEACSRTCARAFIPTGTPPIMATLGQGDRGASAVDQIAASQLHLLSHAAAFVPSVTPSDCSPSRSPPAGLPEKSTLPPQSLPSLRFWAGVGGSFVPGAVLANGFSPRLYSAFHVRLTLFPNDAPHTRSPLYSNYPHARFPPLYDHSPLLPPVTSARSAGPAVTC